MHQENLPSSSEQVDAICAPSSTKTLPLYILLGFILILRHNVRRECAAAMMKTCSGFLLAGWRARAWKMTPKEAWRMRCIKGAYAAHRAILAKGRKLCVEANEARRRNAKARRELKKREKLVGPLLARKGDGEGILRGI